MLFAARAGITGPDIFTLALRLFLGSDYFSVILVLFLVFLGLLIPFTMQEAARKGVSLVDWV